MRKKQSVNLLDHYKKKHINLIPDLYFKKKKRVRIVILVALLASIGVSSFGLHLMDLYNELNDVRVENQLVLDEIKDKEEERNRQLLLSALKKRIEIKSDLLKEIEAENASVLYVANAIESALPSGVLYINVDFSSKDAMTIFGQTKSEAEIPDLIHKLREMNIFDDIGIESIAKNESVNYLGTDLYYDFVLVCTFGGVEDEVD